MTFTADDGQGVNHLSAGSNHTINVTAVDDAPVNNGVPGPFTVMSGATHAITGLSISDVDAAGGNDITTTLTSAGGGIVNVGVVGGGAAITGNGTGAVTLTGTIAQINTSLAGSVAYTAADGATGSSTTTLTIATNDHGHTGTGGPITDTDVIQVGVTQQVWFINGDQTGVDSAAPRGSQTNPFTDVHEFNVSSGPGVNDIIYMKAGTYTGEGINLKDGQTLLGDDQALSLPDPFGGPAIVLETSSGARPTIHVTTAGDQAIDLGQNNTIHGINVVTDAGTFGLDDGQGAGGNAVGTLTVDQMAISGAGQAVDIDQGGALNVSLESLNSTGGAEGVQLGTTTAPGAVALTGSFSGGTGAISGSSVSGFLVGDGAGGASTGGTLTVQYNGTITASNAASVVNIQDHATGAVTLTGNLTHNGTSGAGIVLDDDASNFTFSGTTNNLNTGTSNAINITDLTGTSTVAISGTLNIDTSTGAGINIGGTNGANTNYNFTGGSLTVDASGAGNGFVASGGGTVTVTGSGNHIATVGGTALNISNTNIGASDVTFHDVNANGGTNGIVLNNTGTNGGLTITGDAGSSVNASGGVIQSTTGVGIALTATKDVSLDQMTVQNGGDDGINGNNVTNFSLTNSTVTNNGNALNEHGIDFTNLLGTGTFTNDTFSNNEHNQVQIINNTVAASAASVTFDGVHVSSTGLASAPNGSMGIEFDTQNAASADLTVKNSSFDNLFSNSIEAFGTGTGVLEVTINNDTFTNVGASAINIAQQNNNSGTPGTVRFNIHDNGTAAAPTFLKGSNNAVSSSININQADDASHTGGGVLEGRITNNFIGDNSSTTSASTGGYGITASSISPGTMTVQIDHNNIKGALGGIFVSLGEDGNASHTVNATIDDNTINVSDVNAFNGIFADIGVLAGDAGTGRLDMFNNNVSTTGAADGSANGISVGSRFNTTLQMPGYTGAFNDSAALQTYLDNTRPTTRPAAFHGSCSPTPRRVVLPTPRHRAAPSRCRRFPRRCSPHRAAYRARRRPWARCICRSPNSTGWLRPPSRNGRTRAHRPLSSGRCTPPPSASPTLPPVLSARNRRRRISRSTSMAMATAGSSIQRRRTIRNSPTPRSAPTCSPIPPTLRPVTSIS